MVQGSIKLLALLALLTALSFSIRPQLINGNVSADQTYVRCNTGCSICSSAAPCNICGEGFHTLNSRSQNDNTRYCMACMGACKTCNQADVTDCTSCYDGGYLTNQPDSSTLQTCLPCDESCLRCENAANNCTRCPLATYFDTPNGHGECLPCANNMQSCYASGTTTCMPGFQLHRVGGEATCMPCLLGCPSCYFSTFQTCRYSCSYGYRAVNPASCAHLEPPCTILDPDTGACTICSIDAFVAENDTCVLKCSSPCKFCEADQPTNCTECFDGSTLVNNTCELDLTCNSGSTCTYKDCGSGFNKIYKVAQGKCVDCPAIDNCIQCDLLDNSRCSICEFGYYLSGVSSCTKCPDSCLSCENQYLCYQCKSGFYLDDGSTGQTAARCRPCTRPCATCHVSRVNCLTCVSGYIQNNNKCINEARVTFELVLSASTTAEVTAVITTIYQTILSAAGFNVTDGDRITIYNITASSVLLEGSVDGDENATNADITTLSTNLYNGLASASFGGVSVVSWSTDVPPDTSINNSGGGSTNGDDQLGLIIGLSIGGAAIVAIVVILVCYVMRSKKHMMVQEDSGEFANSKDIIQMESNSKNRNKLQMMPVEEYGTPEVNASSRAEKN